ncbi:hypothetical protein [Flavisphingomonas formosensis]|uniref:hypothetical protein n=1 Tax=Flavisphingomonas formosensis TaxID=861534 RepID=UPI0012FBE954|nr:hypothetical protein [Sphingomonas formosensis]
MSAATITAVQITPTHDGEASVVVELTYANGGRSKIHINAPDAAQVMARAGVASAIELIGHPWSVLEIRAV